VAFVVDKVVGCEGRVGCQGESANEDWEMHLGSEVLEIGVEVMNNEGMLADCEEACLSLILLMLHLQPALIHS
jgi:hypothetical protein